LLRILFPPPNTPNTVKCREEKEKGLTELPDLEPGHMLINPSHTDDNNNSHTT